MMLLLAGLGGLCLAFANGANDNFKGVATLLGSRTAGFRGALVWGTLTTAFGSAAALLLAGGLLETFRGGGLVPPHVALDATFATAVACAAAITVLAATRIGMPISTTHALIGGLLGAGLAAAGSAISWDTLTQRLLLPLLTSPILAFLASAALYQALHAARRRMGVERESCVCIGEEWHPVASLGESGDRVLSASVSVSLRAGADCVDRYRGRVLGLSAERGLAIAHYLSAGSVGFARGLNDTPKIAALLLIAPVFQPSTALLTVGLVMGIGAWVGTRRVAETLSHRITTMNAGQGFTANIVTAMLVIVASRFGMPVSTTHVSCGALIGIGAAGHGAFWGTIRKILLAWLVTMPIAALLAWAGYGLLAAGR